MREIAAQSLVGLPVYSLNEGETMGYVKQLIIDPAGKKLLALAVDKKGLRKNLRIIPSEKIHHLGTDAVTITERTAAGRAANLPQLMKYLNRPNHLIGNRLISDDGQTIGRITEYYIDGETHHICRLDINNSKSASETMCRAAFAGQYIISIGPAAVMIDRAALIEPEILPAPPNPLHKISALTEKLTTRITAALEKETQTLPQANIKSDLFQSSENSETADNNFPVKTVDNMQPAATTAIAAPTSPDHAKPEPPADSQADLQAHCINSIPDNTAEHTQTAAESHSKAAE